MKRLPPWTILHIPHDSVYIPPEVRRSFLLTEDELNRTILKMTDGWTHALFGNGVPPGQIVIAPANRLVVDVERFEDDRLECMAARGMGVVYTITHERKPLRHKPSAREREALIAQWYRPHHQALETAVEKCLMQYGKALVLDAHSFPSTSLPYEDDAGIERPQICIGTDDFHTSKALRDAFVESFSGSFDTGVNHPFAGALVPMRHYGRDARVSAVMIEVRRDLYENEETGALRSDFVSLSRIIGECAASALGAV